MEGLELLEEKEQTLIQHIRTCGLRQTKEASLVEEVMAIRRERRKLFFTFQERSSSLAKLLEERTQELQSVKRDMSTDFAEAVSRYEEELSSQKERLQQLEQLLREERAAQSERAKIIEQTSVGQMKLAYESKVQSLEGKLREIVAEKRNAELTQARSLANSIVKKVTKNIEDSYQRKLAEYKASVASMAERESVALQLAKDHAATIEQLHRERQSLEDQLQSAHELVKQGKLNEQGLSIENMDLLAVIASQKRKLEEVASQAQHQQQQRQQEMANLQLQHERSLLDIDEKIRRMLESKDNEVQKWKSLYEQEKSRAQGVDIMLADLHRQLHS